MISSQVKDCLEKLGLQPADAARLLSVDVKTVDRWMAPVGKIPETAAQALRAWMRLAEMGLPWRPDELPLGMSREELAN